MLPLRSVLRSRTPLLLRPASALYSSSTSPLVSTGLSLSSHPASSSSSPYNATSSSSSRRTLKTSATQGKPEKKWVNQRPAKEAKRGDKPLQGGGEEVITSGGTTKDTADVDQVEASAETVVPSKTKADAIFGSDRDLAVDASELIFPDEPLSRSGEAQPWDQDEGFVQDGVDVGMSLDGMDVGQAKKTSSKGGKMDEPKSPLEHEEVEVELEREHDRQASSSASSTSSPVAAEGRRSSSSTAAAAGSPASSSSSPSASLSNNQENSPSSYNSNNNGASSSGGNSGNNGNSGNSGNNGDGGDAPPPKTGKEVAKVSIPDEYPQVLALPITRRPLFPGKFLAC